MLLFLCFGYGKLMHKNFETKEDKFILNQGQTGTTTNGSVVCLG